MLRVDRALAVLVTGLAIVNVDRADALPPQSTPAARVAQPGAVQKAAQAKASAPNKNAAPNPDEKLLQDIDRRGAQVFDAADRDKDGTLGAIEQVRLQAEGDKAAMKLAKARTISDAALLKLGMLIEGAKNDADAEQPDKAGLPADSAMSRPEYVIEFRRLVKDAFERVGEERAAKLAAAQAQPEEEIVAPPTEPVAQRPRAKPRDRGDSREKRRLQDRARQAEYQRDQLLIAQQREQYRQAIEEQQRRVRSELERGLQRRNSDRGNSDRRSSDRRNSDNNDSKKIDAEKMRRKLQGFDR